MSWDANRIALHLHLFISAKILWSARKKPYSGELVPCRWPEQQQAGGGENWTPIILNLSNTWHAARPSYWGCSRLIKWKPCVCGANSVGVVGRGGHYREHDQPAWPVISWWVIRGRPRHCHVMTPLPNTDTQPLVLHKRTAMVMMAVDLAIGVWWCGVQKSGFISERNNPKTFWSKPLFHDLCAKNATKMPHLQEMYSYIMQLRATQAMHTTHATNEHT